MGEQTDDEGQEEGEQTDDEGRRGEGEDDR